VQLAAIGTLGIASKLFGSRITKLKEEINNVIDEAGLKGKCFVAGTLVLAVSGLIPIENVRAGDKVYSFNANTQEVSKKTVEETFVRESNELVHITVNGETISSTPDHPFYVPQKGFVKAVNLRAGDILWTVNGEYVVVEKVQHEIPESPVKVFNFRVADNHTYFVGNTSVGVHNAKCGGNGSIDDFLNGNKSFEEVKNSYAKEYTDIIKSNKKKWSWKNDIKGGDRLTSGQKSAIKREAIEKGYLPDVKVTKVDSMKYGFADFDAAGVVKRTEYLPENLWLESDKVQFEYLNKLIGGEETGYTWHHTETPGKMELIPYGIHNMVAHNGGRSPGMWAYAKR
jgi:hypothetical protein